MKTKKNKFITVTATLIILGGLTLSTPIKSQPLRNKEIAKYIQNDIIPVLKPLRYELDNKLTKDEKEKIENMRNDLLEIRQNLKAEEITPRSGKLQESKLSESQINTIKQAKESIYQILLETMIISNNHKDDIRLILENENIQKEKWIDDISKIKKENSSFRFLVLSPILKHNLNQIEPFDHIWELLFILWNPNEPLYKSL